MAIIRAAVQNLQAGRRFPAQARSRSLRARWCSTPSSRSRSQHAQADRGDCRVGDRAQIRQNQILEIYLNEFFYGNFAYGVEAAAQTYFDKPARDLNPAEAAFIAGLPQSPATYDPVINREAAMRRMEQVLRLMSGDGTGCIAIQRDDNSPWQVPAGASYASPP